ncbi:MAG: peptide transporter [Alphaproteobacteria bacterium]|jgi:putative OPT family oligopeptide transporter|nr:peptide transporter [Alphaproteobacteria bacterium]
MITSKQGFQPYISASKTLPETTLKAVLLGILLAIVLAGSTAYLGLKMGQTISASIPAAVISMTVLRMFRQSNILENNIVQTIASAGYVVASGIIFTIPALIVMGYWQEFGYWQITTIAIVGGGLGVLFSVPLRRALIIDEQLKFPEGVAAAEVLKAGDQVSSKDKTGVGTLAAGALCASIFKFCQTGLHVLGESIQGWFNIGGAVFGLSSGFTFSMMGAGYIVGMQVAINLLVGAALAWFIGVPLYTAFSTPQDFGLGADASAFDWAMAVRTSKLRYIGVGTMIFGGLYALFSLIGPIRTAIASSFAAIQKSRLGLAVTMVRTDHDIPMTTVLLFVIALSVPVFIIFHNVLGAADLPITSALYWITVTFLTLFSLLIGFIGASIGGYMAGIVGSSANPISGITIGAILAVSAALLVLLGGEISFGGETKESLSLAATVIMIGGVVATAAALSCDNLQDLKAGYILGATPWKQQVCLIVGVIAGACVIAPILQLLYEAYGIGGRFPRLGMDPAHALAAPQATLMASVAEGVFSNALDWPLVFLGVGVGLGIVVIDRGILGPMKSEYRLSVMAVALGIYLPIEVIMPLVIGGTVNFFARLHLKSQQSRHGENYPRVEASTERQGLLFASGLIAGDALVGIMLAIPFAVYQSTTILALVGPSFKETATTLSVVTFAAVACYLYRLGYREKV